MLEHLSMLYILAELVSKEVAINLLEQLSILYTQLYSWLAKEWQLTCWSTSVCYIFWL